MAQAAPQTIYGDLRAQVMRLLSAVSASEFELRRLTADMEKLAPVDYMGSLEIKATLAAVRGDHEASAELFDRLLQLTGGEARFLRSALQISSISGQVLRSKYLYDNFLAGHDLPIAWKREIGRLLCFNGWFRESGRLQDELHACGEDPGTNDASLLVFPDEQDRAACDEPLPVFVSRATLSEILDANNVPDEEVALLFEKSISLLRSWNFPPWGARAVALVHDDSSSGILVSFMVKGEAEAVADAEWELFGELSNMESKTLLDGVVSVTVLAFQGVESGN